MTTITIKNDFHNTSANVRAELLNHGLHFETTLTDSQKKRVLRKLCGMSDCICGGIRGPQDFGGKKLVVNMFTKEQLAR